jgi:hypothetical protein
MENTLLYTFSTIAQTLAGAIALLGAFALYRLQGLTRDRDAAVDRMAEMYRETGTDREDTPRRSVTLLALRASQQYTQILAFLRDRPLPEPHEAERSPLLTVLIRSRSQETNIFRAFYWALWLTVGLILFSVGTLMFVSLVKSSIPWSVAVLSIAGIWLVACMASYAMLLSRTLR